MSYNYKERNRDRERDRYRERDRERERDSYRDRDDRYSSSSSSRNYDLDRFSNHNKKKSSTTYNQELLAKKIKKEREISLQLNSSKNDRYRSEVKQLQKQSSPQSLPPSPSPSESSLSSLSLTPSPKSTKTKNIKKYPSPSPPLTRHANATKKSSSSPPPPLTDKKRQEDSEDDFSQFLEASSDEDRDKTSQKINIQNENGKKDELELNNRPRYEPALMGCRAVHNYTRLNSIDEGTYGVVSRAKDKVTKEVVALKRVKLEPGQSRRSGFPNITLREINLLFAMQHPNVVSISLFISFYSIHSNLSYHSRKDDIIILYIIYIYV